MFSKLTQNLFVRAGIVFVSLIFLAAAALNDGWTEWFWGVPFLFLIYKLSPGNKKIRIAVVLILAGLVGCVSYFKYMSPFVYPFIGQSLETTKPIPTIVLESYQGEMPYYDYMNMKQEMELGECKSCSDPDVVPAGSVLTLEKIIPHTSDFNTNQLFVFTNSSGTVLLIARNEMARDNKDGLGTFCERVNWDTCAEDPMLSNFRVLTHLMYYPAAPVILNYLNPIVIWQFIKTETGMGGSQTN